MVTLIRYPHLYRNDQTGSGVGAYIIIPGTGYETSSGGPFFRGTLEHELPITSHM